MRARAHTHAHAQACTNTHVHTQVHEHIAVRHGAPAAHLHTMGFHSWKQHTVVLE